MVLEVVWEMVLGVLEVVLEVVLVVLEVVLVVLEVVLVVLVVVLMSRCPFERLQSARQLQVQIPKRCVHKAFRMSLLCFYCVFIVF